MTKWVVDDDGRNTLKPYFLHRNHEPLKSPSGVRRWKNYDSAQKAADRLNGER